MHPRIFLFTVMAAMVFAARLKGATVVRVADYGALPDDGDCDAAAIRNAIAAAQGQLDVVLEFDAGVYNLKEAAIETRSGHRALIFVWGQTNWTLRGAVDATGDPATVLEMNLTLENETTGATHLDIRNNTGIAVENLILDQNPRFCTAAEVVSVDSGNNEVVIDVFEGMPHFDGMMTHSANNWDLSTRHLIKGPPVTIGFTEGQNNQWSKVPGYDRRYRITSSLIRPKLQVGQGLSFHFQVIAGDARTIDVYGNRDVRFENIFVHNPIGMAMGVGSNTNMTLRRFHMKPEGNSLAVGPRDGIHMATGNTGILLMEDIVGKGLRWDPVVCYMRFVPVSQRVDDYTLHLDGSSSYHSGALAATKPGSYWRFFSGTVPTERVISEVAGGTVTFTEPLPSSVQAGTLFAPGGWFWDEAIIRRSLFEDNYGTPIVWENNNLTVEHSVFRYNAYDNIGLGPSSGTAGVFARGIVIRNNIFEDSTWARKSDDYRGAIIMQSKSQYFTTQKYHRNILIEDNLFRDIYGSSDPAAIQIKNAGDVVLRNNRYYGNVPCALLVEVASTENIVNEGMQIHRCTGSSLTVESIPSILDGATPVTFPRGANAPVPAFSFESTEPLTIYMAVHDRGTPTIPASWIAQNHKVLWRTSTDGSAAAHTDTIYRRDFPAGTVDIPGHNGVSGSNYGVPHMLFLFSADGKSSVSTNGLTGMPEPNFIDVEPYLLWTGDNLSPLTWAAEVGWQDGTALSVFDGYLLNRRNLDHAFRVEAVTLNHDGSIELAWPSDGLPNGRLTVYATEDLQPPFSEWPPLSGALTFDNGSTRWRSGVLAETHKKLFFVAQFK